MTGKQKTTIAVSKPVHKQLAYEKLDNEYSSFEDMFVNEILNKGDLE
jgi:hypothetical protein